MADQRVSFVPLEAHPEVMTGLLHKLGLSPSLAIHDVYSLEDESLLALIPRPASALLLVFPVSKTYEEHRSQEDQHRAAYAGSGAGEPAVWFRQTIRNACGLMALLHGVYNSNARDLIQPGSVLDKILQEAIPLPPAERSKILEENRELAEAYQSAASQGSTEAPSEEADVDLHYVCFAKDSKGTLWELDGSRKGPIERGTLGEDEDVLSEKALGLGPKEFLSREGHDYRFCCVALSTAFD